MSHALCRIKIVILHSLSDMLIQQNRPQIFSCPNNKTVIRATTQYLRINTIIIQSTFVLCCFWDGDELLCCLSILPSIYSSIYTSVHLYIDSINLCLSVHPSTHLSISLFYPQVCQLLLLPVRSIRDSTAPGLHQEHGWWVRRVAGHG